MIKNARSLVNDWVYRQFNNEYVRDKWVHTQLENLRAGGDILDAGAGSQRYRERCNHLNYVSQDFDSYSTDVKLSTISSSTPYKYGRTDLVCDILSIPVGDRSFDAVLCTEVLEHVPKPVETIKELARILKPGGTLILTVPMNCLRHFDPYFFSSGLSDNWINVILPEFGLEVKTLEPVGDYFSWMKVEVFRSLSQKRWNPLAWVALLPALAFFSRVTKSKESVATLCMGYHVVAVRN